MIIRAFITHKQAELFADCQDRFGVNSDTKSIAVSDGMGSTWQQKIWAQILVSYFNHSNDWLPTHDSIKPLCNTWREEVSSFIGKLKEKNAPPNIIFRNERCLAEGRSAGATFVGIRFNDNEWNGSVLGDSCLIEWNGIEAKFHTSQDVEAFDSYPDYFDSDETKEGKGTPKTISGHLDAGSYLLFVSDPFSDFLLEHNKHGDISDYVQKLLGVSSHDDYETLVEDWRKAGMHNDDTTLVVVEPDDSDEFSIDANVLDDINKLIDEEKKLIEESKKEDSDQIPTSVSNELPEDEVIEITTEKPEAISVGQMELPSPNDSSNNENINKLVVIEKKLEESPVDEDYFQVEFLSEYKKALQKKHSFLGNIKFTWTQKAISETIKVMFKKYSINIK